MCWLERFHVDGLRIPELGGLLYARRGRGTGEWMPSEQGDSENLPGIELLRTLNTRVAKRYPGVRMIAGESAGWPVVTWPAQLGGLGFTARWNAMWTESVLEYFRHDPLHRSDHHGLLTHRDTESFRGSNVLALSHAEVALGRRSLLEQMPGDDWQRFANLRALYAYLFAYPGYKLLFMGAEWATWYEWSAESPVTRTETSLNQGMRQLVTELNRLYRTEPALHRLDAAWSGCHWVDIHNAEQSVIAFERIARNGSRVLAVYNLTPVPRHGYRVGVSQLGTWREILNTDAVSFGGSGVGNFGSALATAQPAHGRSGSLSLTLPPLAAIWLSPPRP
jgi:1,4-alpha-glucan branching enzyme